MLLCVSSPERAVSLSSKKKNGEKTREERKKGREGERRSLSKRVQASIDTDPLHWPIRQTRMPLRSLVLVSYLNFTDLLEVLICEVCFRPRKQHCLFRSSLLTGQSPICCLLQMLSCLQTTLWILAVEVLEIVVKVEMVVVASESLALKGVR